MRQNYRERPRLPYARQGGKKLDNKAPSMSLRETYKTVHGVAVVEVTCSCGSSQRVKANKAIVNCQRCDNSAKMQELKRG